MNLIDPRTVTLLAGVMSGLMSLVLYSLKRNYPASIKGLREWSAALLVLFVAGLLFAGRGKLPDYVAISLANFLLWSGVYLTYVGSQRFFGVRPRVGPWMALITGVLLFSVWFTFIEPSYLVRLRVSNMLMAYLFGVHAWLVFMQGPTTFARMLTVGVLAATSATQLLRFVTSFNLPVGADLLDATPYQQVYISSYTFLILLLSIGLVLMASDRLRAELEHLATHDSLTNALTRRHMNEACQKELERCRRHGRSMALLIMDLDHFKEVNDTYGHQAGDRVLVNFVAKVNTMLRQPDQLGRFGGEEFVLLLPETSREEAISVADRIRAACALTDSGPSCTVSIGITTHQQDTDTVDTLLARADAALYRAKANGRNRVETA
jgi:diguanylate cyclase (GGDEF)-like protein